MIATLHRWWRGRHKWEYRNPYDRTCAICGRHEVQYCADWRDVFDRFKGWWEAHREGNPALHAKERK